MLPSLGIGRDPAEQLGSSERNSVHLNGPGYAGAWPDCRAALQADQWSAWKLTDLWRFGEEMRDGDIVVLRIGTATVLGVGEIVGPYESSCTQTNSSLTCRQTSAAARCKLESVTSLPGSSSRFTCVRLVRSILANPGAAAPR